MHPSSPISITLAPQSNQTTPVKKRGGGSARRYESPKPILRTNHFTFYGPESFENIRNPEFRTLDQRTSSSIQAKREIRAEPQELNPRKKTIRQGEEAPLEQNSFSPLISTTTSIERVALVAAPVLLPSLISAPAFSIPALPQMPQRNLEAIKQLMYDCLREHPHTIAAVTSAAFVGGQLTHRKIDPAALFEASEHYPLDKELKLLIVDVSLNNSNPEQALRELNDLECEGTLDESLRLKKMLALFWTSMKGMQETVKNKIVSGTLVDPENQLKSRLNVVLNEMRLTSESHPAPLETALIRLCCSFLLDPQDKVTQSLGLFKSEFPSEHGTVCAFETFVNPSSHSLKNLNKLSSKEPSNRFIKIAITKKIDFLDELGKRSSTFSYQLLKCIEDELKLDPSLLNLQAPYIMREIYKAFLRQGAQDQEISEVSIFDIENQFISNFGGSPLILRYLSATKHLGILTDDELVKVFEFKYLNPSVEKRNYVWQALLDIDRGLYEEAAKKIFASSIISLDSFILNN